MDSLRFIKTIRSREAFAGTTVEELKQLAGTYPYCHSVHLLLLKKMHQADHDAFPVQLGFSAIHVTNRSVLFYLIHADRYYSADYRCSANISAETVRDVEVLPIPVSAVEPLPDQQETDAGEDTLTGKITPEVVEEQPSAEIVGKDILIGRFIENEPRIVPKEGDYPESVAIAEKSNKLKWDYVTETLANVYLQQGNRKMAIKILEKLSLIFPEKSSYFATRINEIRNLSNRL